MSNHEHSRALSRPTRSPHAVGVLGEGAAASSATDCLAIFPSCVPSRFVMANECLRWWRAVLGAAAQRQQRAFARALRNRWDKAAAAKAAAEKAAADRAAAEKAAADRAAFFQNLLNKCGLCIHAPAAQMAPWNSHKPTFYFLPRAAVLGATATQLKRMQELRDSKLLEKMAVDLNDAFQGTGLIQNILFVSHRWEDWATPDETALHACAHDGAHSSPLPTGGRTGRRPMRPPCMHVLTTAPSPPLSPQVGGLGDAR